MTIRSALLAFAWLCAALATPVRAATWLESWAASPAGPQTANLGEARRTTPGFDDQTIVQIVRLTAGGQALRVRFSNEFGPKPLTIGAATVELVGGGAKPPIVHGPIVLTFAGRSTAVVPPGAPLISDPVKLPTGPLSILKVAMYLPEPVPLCTCHMTGGELVQLSPKGDYTQKPFAPSTEGLLSYRAFLSAVDVQSPQPGPVIVAFGDSITDGYRSTVGANQRWPDRLAERLIAHADGRPVAVVNAGIGGNRILADGVIATLGPSALARFDRDVLAVPGVSHLIILEGVNDIGGGRKNPPSAEDLIAGYRQLIARARAHGVKVIGATILPYEGYTYYYEPEGDVVRQGVNQWIRTSGAFDAVIDFDALMRDPAQPRRLRGDLQSGDWLHPNDAGYRAMGDAIDLSLFR